MKKVFLFFVILFCIQLCKAQVIPKGLLETANVSDCIFEGQVIRSDSYWNADSTYIYTSHTVEITKIFKGDLICGTVEVINPGGRVGDTQLMLSHHLTLRTGELGVFFCNITNMELSQVDFYPETEPTPIEITFSEQGFYRYYFDNYNPSVAGLYYHFDSLAQFYNLVQLYTQLNYVECYNTVVSLPSKSTKREKNQEAPIFPTRSEQEKLKNQRDFTAYTQVRSFKESLYSNNSKMLLTGDTLVYKIENEKMTGNNPKYLEFDIYLRANDNQTYLDNAEPHLMYDTLIFGTNPNIIVDRGTLVQDVNSYDTPFAFYSAPGLFVIPIVGKTNAQNRHLLTTIPEQAVHVKMEVFNCYKNAEIGFTDYNFMKNASIYTLTPNSPPLYNYNNIRAFDDGFCGLCLPYVTNVVPKIVHGGVGEQMSIYGKNFGTTQGSGLVGLPNATNLGATMVYFDNLDSVLWSDTLIIYKVPYHSSLTIQGQPYGGIPSNGVLFLSSSTDTAASAHLPDIKVVSQVMNYEDGVQKLPILLTSSQNSGGYKFYPNTTLKNNDSALWVVSKSLKDWGCFSSVNFALDTNIVINTNPYQKNDTNTVSLGTTPLSNGSYAAGYTQDWIKFCPNNNTAIQAEVDVIFNMNQTWWYDTLADYSNGSTSYIDLYETVLHELGHAHKLGHVYDPVDFPGLMLSGQHIGQRGLQLSDSSIKAAFTVKNLSLSPLSCGYQNHNFISCNGTNSVLSSILNSSYFTLYPIPTEGILYFKLEKELGHDKIEYKVFNQLGATILSGQVKMNEEKIEVHHLPQGIYYFLLDTNKGIFTSKFIKL